MNKDNSLFHITLFKYLTEAEYDKVLERTNKIELQHEEVLFEANTPGHEIFLIETGRIKIFKRVDDQKIVFAELGAGAFFGEMSLLDEYNRSASAEGIESCTLRSLSRDEFMKIINNYDAISAKLLLALAEVFSKRLRTTDKHLETYHLVNKALITNEEFRQLYKVINSP